MFFSFFRSLGGSASSQYTCTNCRAKDRPPDPPLSALMTNDEADGTTETAACLFWMVSWTVTRRPFQSPVALAMSSPTFFGDYEVLGTDLTLV